MSEPLRECPSCAMAVPAEAAECPVCGYEFPAPKAGLRPAAWLMIALMLLVGLPALLWLLG